MTILPVDNNAPVVTTGNDFYVTEGGVSVISPSYLSIVDVDSLPDSVLCTVQSQPEYGFLELSSPIYGSEFSRSGQPISAFSLLDLNQGHLSYRQSIHEGSAFSFYFILYGRSAVFVLNSCRICNIAVLQYVEYAI